MFYTMFSKSRAWIWDMDNYLITFLLIYHTFTLLHHKLFLRLLPAAHFSHLNLRVQSGTIL